MSNETRHLPVLQDDLDNDEPSCSPKIYVSNEEVALLAAMRDLRNRSLEMKKELRDADPDRRSRLESEITKMRAEWKDLATRRERAFVRKMIMLGHLPPSHPSAQ